MLGTDSKNKTEEALQMYKLVTNFDKDSSSAVSLCLGRRQSKVLEDKQMSLRPRFCD